MCFSDPILLGCLLTVFLPLSAFALIMIFTRDNHKLSLAISLVASTIPLIIAWTFFFKLGGREPIIYNFDWLVSDLVKVPFGFLLDPTSLVMFVIVATISWLVQVYSIGYMAGDPGFGRFYADLSLFALAMLTLVISSGLLQLYIAWELVGLASYLLIGFWYEKFSASEAGKKAFVVTRFGDIGFFMGLVFLTIFYGSLDIATVNAAAVAKSMPPWLITTSGLLIFCGVMGKSAQFPLHVWLPDAMEGPTPVSALLHSATMVAAGVYLMTRIFPFFAASATTMTVILAISTITLILSSTIGMVATDIKQVWAYSTISQLGFMAMGLAAAGPGLRHPVRRLLPPDHPRRLQGPAVPVLRRLHPPFRHQRLLYHGNPGGPQAAHPHGLHHHRRPGPGRHLPLLRLLQQGADPDGPGPSGQQALGGPGPLRGLPDGLLRLPGDLRHALPQGP